MTSTIERRPADQTPSEDHRHRRRILYVVTAILAIATVVLAGIVIFGDDSGAGASMPAEVEQVLEEYREAFGNKDAQAVTALLTPSFRAPEYIGDPDGAPVKLITDTGLFEWAFGEQRHYLIERNGDPIVVGDGPWYVTYAETYRWHEQKVQWEVSETYVLVERNGEILIDEIYFAGHPVPWESP